MSDHGLHLPNLGKGGKRPLCLRREHDRERRASESEQGRELHCSLKRQRDEDGREAYSALQREGCLQQEQQHVRELHASKSPRRGLSTPRVTT